MDTPTSFIAYVAVSAVAAIVLLLTAPVFLLNYGLVLAWTWISILATWTGIEGLHADYEDHEFESPRDRAIVEQLRRVRAEHDSFGVAVGRSDPLWLTIVRLAEQGYVEKVSSYSDVLDDCWWRATI